MADCAGPGSPNRSVTTIVEELFAALPASARILDAGCGQGVPLLVRANRSATGIGLDSARGQLARARVNAPTAPLVQGDMRRLPFPADTFDLITASRSITHVSDRHHRAVLAEFKRILRANGRLLLLTDTATWRDADGRGDHPIGSLATTRERLRAVGFSSIDELAVRPDVATDAARPIYALAAQR